MRSLVVDLQGLSLTAEDKALLKNPLVAGVILFSRNYADPMQLFELTREIRALSPELLISVDHEGGRVQRFKTGFTLIPPAQSYAVVSNDLNQAASLAFDAGWVLAMELMAFDIDLSYAPVLDLGHQCLAIGSRAFHHDLDKALMIASAMIDGMHTAGMKTTGKHFPGHGAVVADSHKETPIDNRDRVLIEHDMQIFAHLMPKLDAIMPAHVIYPAIDDKPASGSRYWLKTVLREQLQFKGVIFSDDLSMEGAAILGNYAERAEAALEAGCDLLLACNNRQGTLTILDYLATFTNVSATHLCTSLHTNNANTLLKSTNITYSELVNSSEWQKRHHNLMKLNEQWTTYYASGNN